MEEKYITKLLNFSSDIMCNAKELVITKEQAKGIIKELEQDYIPKAVIRLKIANLKKRINEINKIDSIEEFTSKQYEQQGIICKIYTLKELLGE